LGSRFARVEFCAASSTILRVCNVELEEGNGKGAVEKAKAQLTSGAGFEVELKMKALVKLIFVKRSKLN
jgi:hypothetical protein